MDDRREFLKKVLSGSGLLALGPALPRAAGPACPAVRGARDGNVLVVLFLAGGNDGINTVVPHRDDGYARRRTVLRLPKDKLLAVDASVGLHPSLRGAAKLLESGRLAIVQGVGYPKPSLSHFDSTAIWQGACLEAPQQQSFGWLGKALDPARDPASGKPQAVFVGDQDLPLALRGRRALALTLRRPEDLLLSGSAASAVPDASGDLAGFVARQLAGARSAAGLGAELTRRARAGGGYPATRLGQRLATIAQLLRVELGARVYFTTQAGYDTHTRQLAEHEQLLRELGDALLAFLDDLQAAGLAERVCVMVFSEFGRRVAENASAGTDHGTAGPVLLAGPRVLPGLHGSMPSLGDLDDDNLKSSVDFRRIYATLLESWLGMPAEATLGGSFERLELLRG